MEIDDKFQTELEQKSIQPQFQSKYWQGSSYSPLLNQNGLIKSLKRDIWKYELKSMLNGFIDDMGEYQQNIKFKVSGKILDSSAYVLKRKSNNVIHNSLETQEDIKEAQVIEPVDDNLIEDEGGDFEEYDEDDEIYEAFCELNAQNLLDNEQWAALQEEKVNRVLDLEASELNKRLRENKSCLINLRPKVIYKKMELKDLSEAFNDALNIKNIEDITQKAKHTEKIKKEDLPFLPENFIANAEQKRANFEKRIDNFYDSLKNHYNNEPISFLSLVTQPSVKGLVDTLLIILHLINFKKIEIWKSFIENGEELREFSSENSGQNIFLSPL